VGFCKLRTGVIIFYASVFALCAVNGNSRVNSSLVGKTITLKSKATGLYTTAWGFEPSVEVRSSANAQDSRTWFDVIDAGSGLISLRSRSNNAFWSAQGKGSDIKIMSSSKDADSSTLFTMYKNSDSTYSLESHANGKYLSVVETDTVFIPGIDSSVVRRFEQLKKEGAYDSVVATRPIISPEMQKPQLYKYYLVRARAGTIGVNEKFGLTELPSH
jgi:hypothetical protein